VNLLAMVLVAAVLFAAVASIAMRFGYPIVRPWLARLPASMRARLVFGATVSPVVLAASLGLLALLPGVVALVWPALDHCAHHDDGHLHLCVVHGPPAFRLGLGWVVLAAVLGPASIALGRTMIRVAHGRRLLEALRRTARRSPDGAHLVVESAAPFAMTAGLVRPRVYVSTGLLGELDALARRAVLAHEAEHVRRLDPLTKLAAELASALHLPSTRAILLEDLALACEQACDERAALAVGDRMTVASALVRLGRMIERCPLPASPILARFGESSIEARVHALLAPPMPTPAVPSRALLATVGVVAAGLAAAPIHHVTETILGKLVG
jgi:Zn-dependent protease with chaperone function